MFVLEIFVSFLAIVLPVLISVAYLTLAERKIMGGMQQRVGPNVVGFFGKFKVTAPDLISLATSSFTCAFTSFLTTSLISVNKMSDLIKIIVLLLINIIS